MVLKHIKYICGTQTKQNNIVLYDIKHTSLSVLRAQW